MRYGPLEIDFERLRVTAHGRPVNLSSLQLRLLVYLARRAGAIVTREDLFEALWRTDALDHDAKVVDVVVCRLRQRLRDAGMTGSVIESVRAHGYRLRGADDDDNS
jgi:DNA-binding response OmpR family regulator